MAKLPPQLTAVARPAWGAVKGVWGVYRVIFAILNWGMFLIGMTVILWAMMRNWGFF